MIIGITTLGIIFSLIPFTMAQEQLIPSWIKNTAGFWSNDQITDREFLGAIQFLINKGILVIPSDISQENVSPNEKSSEADSSDIPITSETLHIIKTSDVGLLQFKIEELQKIAQNQNVIDAIEESNKKFASMDDPDGFIDEHDLQWKETPFDELTPFMGTVLENEVANFLKQKSIIPTDEFGDVLFPEIIITNTYGANVAITTRTSDYDQADESWWIKAINEQVQVRDIAWDESAGINSADIVIRIVDDNGKFIGVLKAATPVR